MARPGVATGRAAPCAGPMAELVAHLSVYRGLLVDRMSVPAGSTFRFRLAPGIYIISNQGHPGRFVGSKPFRVRSGTYHSSRGEKPLHVGVRSVWLPQTPRRATSDVAAASCSSCSIVT